MPSPRRIEKINNLIREEIAEIIDRTVEIPDNTILTVTRADSSPDGHYATIFFSVIGAGPTPSDMPDGPQKTVLAILEKDVYGIQKELNRRLRMRPVPKIVFAPDRGEEHRETVERTLITMKTREQ